MASLLLVRSPGVYRAEKGTWLVADVMHRDALCTGTGALAAVAHRHVCRT